MKSYLMLKLLVVGLACVAMSSCSFFASGRQSVYVETNTPDAIIKIDGQTVATDGSAVVQLSRKQSHLVVAQRNHVKKTAILDSGLSLTGALDIVGGCCWLFPFLGLSSEGAWQLYPDIVTFEME
ncbi:MAG: hypothetical protein II349_01190 [Akkermansia sp.]|nr:hypothetical protein [Akkermansia sp.]